MTDKRSATVSARITPELEVAARAVARIDRLSVSEYIEHLIAKDIEERRRAYQELRSVFGDVEDLHCKHPVP